MSYQPRNILVTGGAGFIGSHFIKMLLDNETQYCIVNLDKLTYAANFDDIKQFSNNKDYQFILGDICDSNLIKKIFHDYNIDTVVHFAAETHVDRSIKNPETFIQSNIIGTFQLLEQAKHYWFETKKWDHQSCRFHHISTDEVYGDLSPLQKPVEEGGAYDPSSPYSASKASADHLVKSYFHTYGLPLTISQCTNNYGPMQHSEKFIPMIIQACRQQKVIGIYGDGLQVRDWLYVRDHCSAILKVITNGIIGKNYHISANDERTNREVCNIVCELLNQLVPGKQDYRQLITNIEDRPGHDRRYALASHKIKTLGWQPSYTLEQGLLQTIQSSCIWQNKLFAKSSRVVTS